MRHVNAAVRARDGNDAGRETGLHAPFFGSGGLAMRLGNRPRQTIRSLLIRLPFSPGHDGLERALQVRREWGLAS